MIFIIIHDELMMKNHELVRVPIEIKRIKPLHLENV